MRLGLVIAAVVLAGCASPSSPTTDAPPAADLAPPALEPPTFRPPVSLGPNGRTAEPSMAVAPDGTIYVAAAPHLFRSDDGGAFETLGERRCTIPPLEGSCPPAYEYSFTTLDGFSSGDTDIGVDANGTLYFLGLAGKMSVPFHASRDRGETWSEPFDVADGNASDRQWMEVLPDATIFTTWRDFGADAEGPRQILFRRSPDGGATWDPIRVIGPDPLIQGPLAVDLRTRAVYTSIYDGGIRVARSLDEGLTWTFHDVALEARDTRMRDGRPIDMFPIPAVDAAGNVYVAWAADDPEAPAGAKEATWPRVRLSVSRDGGETWSAPRAVSPEGKVATFPWIVAGGAGRVAITWYEGRGGTPSHLAPDLWDVALVESVDAASPDATFVGGFANTDPVHAGAICRSGGGCVQECTPLPVSCAGYDRSRSELFEMALRDGHPVLAWVADARPPATGIELQFGGVASGTPLREG